MLINAYVPTTLPILFLFQRDNHIILDLFKSTYVGKFGAKKKNYRKSLIGEVLPDPQSFYHAFKSNF